jgi:hypothetical protein
VLSPIANSTTMERWKEPLAGSEKSLKPNSYSMALREWCHPFRKTDQGVNLCSETNPVTEQSKRKRNARSLRVRSEVLTGLKLHGFDPKPDDLFLGMVKQSLNSVEASTGSTSMCSVNLGIGVKSSSSRVIAGSCQNRPQSSLSRDCFSGRATD